MKIIIILCTCFLLISCASVQDIYEFDDKISSNILHISSDLSNINKSYDIANANYIKSKKKLTDNNTLLELTKKFSSIKKERDEFNYRANIFNKILTEKQEEWGWYVKEEVSSNDQEWDDFVKLREYYKSEYIHLNSISKNYKNEISDFNDFLKNSKIKDYIKSPFDTHSEAIAYLDVQKKKQEQDKYNQELIENLIKNSKSFSKDFESIVNFSNFESYAKKQRKKYGEFLRYDPPVYSSTRKNAKEIISQVVNDYIILAAKPYAKKQSSIREASKNLQAIEQGPFEILTDYMSKESIAEVNNIFEERKSTVFSSYLDVSLEKANTISSSNKSPSNRLRSLVKFDSDFRKKNSDLLNEPLIQKHLEDIRNLRWQLINKMEPKILASIYSAKSLADLKDPLVGLITSSDKNLPPVIKIKNARNEKLRPITKFTPVKNASQLKVNSFTADGLNYESELLAIYLGDFKHSRLERNSIVTHAILRRYIENYGKLCSSYLPKNKVPITEPKCKTERVTRNGWGVETSRQCVAWIDVPTGLYADPALYKANSVSANNADKQTSKNIQSLLFSKNKNSFIAGRALSDDVLSLGADMESLVKKNRCNNAGLKRFENNLLNFVLGNKPIQLSNKEDLSLIQSVYNPPIDPEKLDFDKLIDNLILENSKGWSMNRYNSGNVYDVNVKYDDDRIYRLNAGYRFYTFAGSYTGRVALKFNDNIPECLYFHDAPNTCRKPSRKIINNYLKGKYLRK